MATLDEQGAPESQGSSPVLGDPAPLLFDGLRLDQPEFHERYCRMPDDFRAELIDGVVFVNMPLYEDHAIPDASLTGLLYFYRGGTPGTLVLSNPSTKLGPKSEVQPDCVLKIDPAYGGRTARDEKGLTLGGPEMVVEVAYSSIQIDLKAKKRAYEEAGSLEYIVLDVSHRQFHWFALCDGRFEPVHLDPDGLYRSRAFPGFWLDEAAFFRDDVPALFATLRLGLESPEHADFVERLRQYRANRA
jgi:hypothetical protein